MKYLFLIFIGIPLMPILRSQYKYSQLWEAWLADWHGIELTGQWKDG